MATITRTVNGKRVTTNLGESSAEFSKRLRREKIARKTAQDIRRSGGSAQVSNGLLLQVEQPTLYDISGQPATPKDGFIEGYSQADLNIIRNINRKNERDRKKFSSSEVARRFISGELINTGVPLKDKNISIQRFATTPTRKEEQSKQIVRTLPSGVKTAQLLKSGSRIPEKLYSSQQQFLNEVKPIKISKFEKVKRKYEKVERKTAQKLRLDDLSNALTKKRKILGGESVVGKTVVAPAKLFTIVPLPKRVTNPISEVAEEITKDTLNKPITNSALILASAGITKGVQGASLGLSKLATNSPKIDKGIGLTGKAFGSALSVAYIYNILGQAINEYKTSGKFTKTTAKTVKELALFSFGARLGSSQKTLKLTQLRKEINKLPKAEQTKLLKRFAKLEKIASKEFKTKELGIVTKLDTQQIGKTIKDGKIKTGILTATENKIYFAKKIPKKTQTFNVDVYFKRGFATKGVEASKYGKATVKAKYNSKTGKVVILDKNPKIDYSISDKQFNTFIKRFGKGKTFENLKKINVKGFERRAQPKNILELKSKDVYKNLKDVKILSKSEYNKRFGKKSRGVFTYEKGGKNSIFIKDTADFRKGILDKRDIKLLLSGKLGKKFDNLKSNAEILRNVVAHEKGHNLDLISVNKPIFDGVKNIKTDKQFLKFIDKLNKQGLLSNGKDSAYFIGYYKPNKVPLEVRAELYKTFIQNPQKLKKFQPKIYNNIINAMKKEGVIPTINKVGTKDVKINIKPYTRNIKEVLSIDKLTFSKKAKSSNVFDDFIQFTISPKSKKVTPKVDKPIKIAPKFDEYRYIDKDGNLLLQVKKVATTPIFKTVIKKPVISTTKISSSKGDLRVFPVSKGKGKVEVEKPNQSVKSSVRTNFKPTIITIDKQKVEVKPISQIKPIIDVVRKPTIKSSSRAKISIKPVLKVESIPALTTIQKPKIKVITKQSFRKPKIGLKIKKPTTPIKIPIFLFSKKKKQLKTLKVKDLSTLTKYTTTVTRPKTDKGEGIRFKDIELFTGTEFR